MNDTLVERKEFECAAFCKCFHMYSPVGNIRRVRTVLPSSGVENGHASDMQMLYRCILAK
jgi:hypothetical protein